MKTSPLARLRHHVSGAIARGEAEAIVEQPTSEVARRRRVLAAIAECDAYIAKEGPRSSDLRPADVQSLLDFYINHRASLLAKL